jgi:integrase
VTWAELGRVIEGLSGDLTGARDAALLATGYDTMARISELGALTVADITYHEDGDGVALVGRSKTDQEGQGAFRFLSRTTCGLLRTWIAVARVSSFFSRRFSSSSALSFCASDTSSPPYLDFQR